jgi:hypothetical protein
VGTPDFLSSSASPSLVLFWCFGLGQIFKGSNQSCEGTWFVVLDSGVQVLVPLTGAGTLLLELAQEWTKELDFLQDLELKMKPLLNTCSGCLGGQVDSFLKKLASRLNFYNEVLILM